MKLAPQSIPYRALQKVSGIVVVLIFFTWNNDWGIAVSVGLAAAVLLVAGGYELAYYRRFEYELTEDTLDISSGVISRREREIPYRRIQNVDVSRSIVQRAIGVAAVDLETAGGSSTEGSIRFVTPTEATRLQREVQRRKSTDASGRGGDDGREGSSATGPVEEELFAISPRELAMVGALSFDGRLIGLLAFLGSGSFPVLSSYLPGASAAALTAAAIVAVGALFLVSWILGAAVSFSNYYGFQLSRAGDELRYERGLLRRYSGSIPTEKVQTLTISDNPAKRALGYATLSIETAGYAPGQGGDDGSQAAVPIARIDRVYELAREVESFGSPSFHRPPKRIRWRYVVRYAIMVGVLLGIAFAVDWYLAVDLPWYVPAALLLAVPAAAHLKWKHRGYWLGEDHLLTRNGFWSRSVRAVPYYRIQNVIDNRTVFQRRWNVATIIADTAGTNSLIGGDAAAVDIDVADAVELRDELNERLQSALTDRRDNRTTFEWFEGDADGPALATEGSHERTDRHDDPTKRRDDSIGESDGPDPYDGGRSEEHDDAGGRSKSSDIPDAETAADRIETDLVNGGGADGDDADGDDTDGDATDESDANGDNTEETDASGDTDGDTDSPADGVVRPDFSPSDRDYSEPAERIDTGEYAVDRNPSDADVAHRSDDREGETDPSEGGAGAETADEADEERSDEG